MNATQPDLFEQIHDRPRRMPSMRAIEGHHGIEHGRCYRCGQSARYRERAHVVNHCYGGADAVENLVPLCYRCHAQMPDFQLDEERYGWAWLHGDARAYFTWRARSLSPEDRWRRFGPDPRRGTHPTPDDLREIDALIDGLPGSLSDTWWEMRVLWWPGVNGEDTDMTGRLDAHRAEGRAAG